MVLGIFDVTDLDGLYSTSYINASMHQCIKSYYVIGPLFYEVLGKCLDGYYLVC